MCALGYLIRGRRLTDITDAVDPGLLRKHTTFRSYRTAATTYPRIRTFYHAHPHAEKLPNKPPLPLLVFVHGLGGSISQFNSLLTTLVNSAPCFGIDLPGCGLSDFAPTDWAAYSHRALVKLLATAIQQACDASSTRQVVLISHSLGCSLAVSLAAPGSSVPKMHSFEVVGLIAICPLALALGPEQARTFRRILSIPTPLFDLWRKWDQAGGIDSPSVRRFVGARADSETRKLQLRYNKQSRTAVWRRMAWGSFFGSRQPAQTGLPDAEIWASLRVPIILFAGADDPIARPEEISVISKALSAQGFVRYHQAPDPPDSQFAHAAEDGVGRADAVILEGGSIDVTGAGEGRKIFTETIEPSAPTGEHLILKTYVLPSPATHSLLFDHSTYRTISGLMQNFLADHVDPRLSLGWQLQHLKDANKWDVKNLAKWKAVKPVSEPIAGIFRAMKTLREVDEVHSPTLFVSKWKHDIKAVVDISHESPVYNPRELDAGGIEYHKFPTVSKLPPTPTEVDEFTALVDRLRASDDPTDRRLVGVHCHYGFNRTGFFICAYLIQREGYHVQQVLDEFEARRYPGIRHEHFIDTLFVRYCVGLKRPSVT